MYLNCLLQNCLWCLPWKLPYGNGHYVTGCDLVILSNAICIEQCLTNFSCNILGCSPKTPFLLNNAKKTGQEVITPYNNSCYYNYYDNRQSDELCSGLKVCINDN